MTDDNLDRWRRFVERLKDKKFVIRISFLDRDDKLIENFQTFGVVSDITDNGLFIFKRIDNSEFVLPYDRDSIEKAKEGEYKTNNPFFIVNDPDYLTTWEILVDSPQDIIDIKKKGYHN